MKKIAVINFKGGTGKTSTVVNLAHGLALRGKKVLIIDTDPQGSASYNLGNKSTDTLYEVIVKNLPLSHAIKNVRKNLDLLPGSDHLYPLELKMAILPEKEHIFSRVLSQIKNYDYIIVDCGPGINLINQNVLLFAEEIIIPVSMEYLSLVGVKQLLKNIKIINKIFDKEIKICKVVPTFVDYRNKKTQNILQSLTKVFPTKISNEIKTCVGLSEAPGFNMSIFEYDKNSRGAEDYFKLVDGVLEK